MVDPKRLFERGKGKVKEKVGEFLDDEDLRREGKAQRKKVESEEEAETFEKAADERRQQGAGHKGEEKARRQQRHSSLFRNE